METYYHCFDCSSEFDELNGYDDGDVLVNDVCPECGSENWEELVDSPCCGAEIICDDLCSKCKEHC